MAEVEEVVEFRESPGECILRAKRDDSNDDIQIHFAERFCDDFEGEVSQTAQTLLALPMVTEVEATYSYRHNWYKVKH